MAAQKQKIVGVIKLTRPQFLFAYFVIGLGGLVFGMVHLQFVPNLAFLLYSFLPLMIAAIGVHFRNEAHDWLAGFDQELGGMGVIREGIFSARSVQIAGTVLVILSFPIGVYQALQFPPLFFVGVPMGILILAADYLAKKAPLVREFGIAGSYWGTFLWVYLGQFWPLTFPMLVTSVFVFLLVFALIPLQDFGDYEADIKSGKKTLVTHLGVDKAGQLCILLALIAMLILYGSLILL